MELRGEQDKVGKDEIVRSNIEKEEEIEIEVGNLKKEIEDAFLGAKRKRDIEINKLLTAFQETIIRKFKIQMELKLNKYAEIMKDNAEILRQNAQIMRENSEKLVARELEIQVLRKEIEVLRNQNIEKDDQVVEEIEIEVGYLNKEIEDAFLDGKRKRDIEINKLISALNLINDDLELSFQEILIKNFEIQKELELKTEFKKIEALMSDHFKTNEKVLKDAFLNAKRKRDIEINKLLSSLDFLNDDFELSFQENLTRKFEIQKELELKAEFKKIEALMIDNVKNKEQLNENAEMMRSNSQILRETREILRHNAQIVKENSEILVERDLEIKVLRKEIELLNLQKALRKVE